MKIFRIVAYLFCLLILAAPRNAPLTAQTLSYVVHLPLLTYSGCDGIQGESYAALAPVSPHTDRPAEQHADLNLALRGYQATNGALGLVDYGGTADGKSPKLFSLFADPRVPAFSGVSQVYDWNWATNSRGALITDPPVTLAGMRVEPNEILRVPKSEYNIGTIANASRALFRDRPNDDGTKFEVLVLYATENRITLKYTRDDNVVKGYTLHIENVCVAPDLLSLYRMWNDKGRGQLPALKQGQAFGRALGNEIGVVIRDNGSFMDPRSKKDWW